MTNNIAVEIISINIEIIKYKLKTFFNSLILKKIVNKINVKLAIIDVIPAIAAPDSPI